MTHLWLRAEQRDNETRVGITPEGVTAGAPQARVECITRRGYSSKRRRRV